MTEAGRGGTGSDLEGLGVQVIGSQPFLARDVSPQQDQHPAEYCLGWYLSARLALVLTKLRIS